MSTVKKLVMAAASAAFLGLGVADVKPASAVLINFEDDFTQEHGTTITQAAFPGGFTIRAVPFGSDGGGGTTGSGEESLTLGPSCDEEFCSQPNALYATLNPEIDEFQGIIRGDFNRRTEDLRLTIIDAPTETDTIRFFDGARNLIASDSITTANPDGIVAGRDGTDLRYNLTGFPVRSFEVLGNDTGIDNVEFTPVPEPSSVLGTVAIGALGGGLMLRRKLKGQTQAKAVK